MHHIRQELLELTAGARCLAGTDFASNEGRVMGMAISHLALVGIVQALAIKAFPSESERVATSREVMIAGGVDPDAPFDRGSFPSEMRQALPVEPAQRTDEQIVDECNVFAMRLLKEVFGYDFDEGRMLTYNHRDPRARKAWKCAVLAFDHFQQTPADEALENIRGDA